VEVYGLELARLAELASGTVQPILARLEICGWVESRWEDQNPSEIGRPLRRYYRLTPDGVVYAVRALDKVRTPAAVLARLHPRPATGSTS
jgi:PadR family transcriptional regulator, regulatory protein PadR